MVDSQEARSAELAITSSYPTNARGIIVLLNTPTKPREFFPTLFVKTTDFQHVFNFEQTSSVTIFDVSRQEVEGNSTTRGKTKLTGFPGNPTLSVLLYFHTYTSTATKE